MCFSPVHVWYCMESSKNMLSSSPSKYKRKKISRFKGVTNTCRHIKVMSKRYNEVFSVGAMLCFTHLKQETALSRVNENTNLCTETQTQQEQTYMTPTTPNEEFDPGEINVSQEILDESLRSRESVTEVLNASPIKFRLKRKFEYLENTTKDKLKRKYVRLENLLKKKFAEAVAPGQEEILIDFLNSKNVDEINSPLPIEIIRAEKVYKQSDSMGKLVILSLLDHTKYTKKFIMNTFECTKHRIETARKWHASHKGLAFPEKKVFVRSSLDQTKCEHFLDFIFTSGILHDVAYGITKLKYDSGEKQKIVHAILTTKYSHAIMFYQKSCNENNYIPLSDSSLWKVLHAIKPSSRKSLAGLDDVTASGMNGFQTLQKLAQRFSSKSLEAALEKGKRYLKTSYQTSSQTIDQPHIKKMFTKSDNAGCYQGNLSAEAIYNVCKERDIKLLRYDYNEPCCGKDQCDRESAVVKTILRSYVDSGNNLLTAEDIHKAMHYSFGAKDAKVAVAQISNDKTIVTGPKIKNISNYHSFEFGEKSMKMWRYFNIGEGIEQEYGNLKIQPSIKLLLPYSKTDNSIKLNKSLKEKQKRSDRQLYSLRFCTEMNCTLSFESDAELEEHMLSGLHTVPKSVTSLDKVRNSFVHKMKITSQLNTPISSSSNSASVKDKPHCMNIFLLQGWALPVRSSFRLSNQQKELLYKYFIRGEESGNKMSPEQVHMQLRRELPPDQYVTSQQIRSLFSRFSNLKRKGKLVEPTTENNENSQVNDNKEVYGKNDDFNLTGDNEDDNKYEEDIANLAKEICLVWKVNDWVAVAYEKQWNIGYIVEVSITGIRVNCMINGQGKNTFRWPVTTEEINNQTDKIICLVNAPFLISGCGDYSLSEEDYNTVISLFLEKLTAAE
ncbi:uncharacterized protein LOC100207340 [Hydra vulgaris]|uniref:uncharacterized protein LOC100207340 n=1 Tax=Hydra vulgaris TaxID=6087 RepID=UPI0032EA509C